ncbi:MAG: leucine-rich repeat domain-containing protein [Chlamydiota bacterium]
MFTVSRDANNLHSTSLQQTQQIFDNKESIKNSLNITETEESSDLIGESFLDDSDTSFFKLETPEKAEGIWNKQAKQFFKDNSPETWKKCWTPHTMVQVNITESFCNEKGIARPCTSFKNLNDFKIVKDEIERADFKFIKIFLANNPFIDESTMDLNSMKISILPLEIEKHSEIQNLKISHNLLKWIPYSVTQFSNLQTLNLSHNQIEELPGQLSGLESLQVLDISYNRLTNLSLKILNQLPLIKKIDVSYNEIEGLPKVTDETTQGLEGTMFIEGVGRLREGHKVGINFVGNPLPEGTTTHSIGRIKFIVEDKTKKKILEWLPTLQLSSSERAKILELEQLIHGKT